MPSGLGMASVINLSLLTSRPQGKLRTSEDQIHLIERDVPLDQINLIFATLVIAPSPVGPKDADSH